MTYSHRYTAENVHTNASTVARPSQRPVYYVLTFDNIPEKNLSR